MSGGAAALAACGTIEYVRADLAMVARDNVPFGTALRKNGLTINAIADFVAKARTVAACTPWRDRKDRLRLLPDDIRNEFRRIAAAFSSSPEINRFIRGALDAYVWCEPRKVSRDKTSVAYKERNPNGYKKRQLKKRQRSQQKKRERERELELTYARVQRERIQVARRS